LHPDAKVKIEKLFGSTGDFGRLAAYFIANDDRF